MIHYHGGPITPASCAIKVWRTRHAFVSWANPNQEMIAVEESQSFALDNGAFSFWAANKYVDWKLYASWVAIMSKFPNFDFAIIPDIIDGSEQENDELINTWELGDVGVPVFHLHESLGKMDRLVSEWPRVAIGSSGDYAAVGDQRWFMRMSEVMNVACDNDGFPRAKLHGLRMLNPNVFKHFPFSSADSTNVARNIGIDKSWSGSYPPASKETRALVLAERIEQTNSASKWDKQPIQVALI